MDLFGGHFQPSTLRCIYPVIYFIRASLVVQWQRICLQCRRCRRHGFNPWVRKIPWKRKWPSIPVFLLEKSHGQGNLWAIVHSVVKSQTKLTLSLSLTHTHTHTHTHTLHKSCSLSGKYSQKSVKRYL